MLRRLSAISKGMEKGEVSELYCKKAPRIISRGRLRSANASAKKEEESVKNECEVDDEVGEGFVVRGGVMMQIADDSKEQRKPMKRFYIDVSRSQIYQNAEADGGTLLDDEVSPSHVAVELSAHAGDGRVFHICDNLPGIANEVESYPCSYCPNRIFLTSFGLERHTEMAHRAHLPEVMEEISRIHNEWKRREAFKAVAKERREMFKKTRMLTEVVRRSQNVQFEGRRTNIHNTNALSCHICGLGFEANCEFMMGHLRAHRKNDDLRRRLLTNFGPSYVARCTCYQCHLVFANEKNLMLHKESSHIRKRKYVCKWCGNVCLSVNELNEHKKDMHGESCSRVEESSFINTINSSQRNAAKHAVVATNGSAEKQALPRVSFADTSSGSRASLLNQNPCITKCSECGLTTVKPSLLIRHMQRVHNNNRFSAVIEVKGLPNIRVHMDRGKVTWCCCNFSFEDKYRFIHHRKTYHQPLLEYSSLQNYTVNSEEQIAARHSFHARHEKNSDFMSTGQIVELTNHDETHDGELYVVSEGDNSEQGRETFLQETQTDESVIEGAQQITLTPREFMQLRQQIGESFDGAMEVFLVDDVSNTQQQSPNSEVEQAVDFNANDVADNDVLNSLLMSSTQIPVTNDRYYPGSQATESQFSIVSVSDPMDDKILQNISPLSSNSLVNIERSSSSLSVPPILLNCSGMVDNTLNCHFQVQKNTLSELAPVRAVVSQHNEQQFRDNIANSSTVLCPELDEISRSLPETSSIIAINNKEIISPPSLIGYCFMGDSKTSSFLVSPINRPVCTLDSIPTLLDLNSKNSVTTVATKTVVKTSSLQQLSTTSVGDAISSYMT